MHKFQIVISILSMSLIAGCVPAEASSTGNCFPDSVFTANDMQARVDCHPDEYKLEINDDTVVLFAFPDPLMDWVGPVFVIHIPTVSETVLNTDGSVLFEDYKTTDGENAIRDVLSDRELLNTILKQAREIENKTQP